MMLNFTKKEELDHHLAYHDGMQADWCKFCLPFALRDKLKPSLHREEPLGDVVSMGEAFPAAELRASGQRPGGPQ